MTTSCAQIAKRSFATCALGVASQWSLRGQFAPIAQRQLLGSQLSPSKLLQGQSAGVLAQILLLQETGMLRALQLLMTQRVSLLQLKVPDQLRENRRREHKAQLKLISYIFNLVITRFAINTQRV